MSYFSDNYDRLSYPLLGHKERGLRKAQRGAIWSIGSHFSQTQEPALISLPTGTGKTGLLMMTPFMLLADRVLVVTPSRLVRDQIAEDFKGLRTLRKADIIAKGTASPRVLEVDGEIHSTEEWEALCAWDVVVATPNSVSPALKNVPTPPPDLFDVLLIDEAHHSAAETWNELILAFPDAKKVLFTATPHRRDKKEIRANLIYAYSLREAHEDKVFGDIEFVPISSLAGSSLARDKIQQQLERDERIARRAQDVLQEDRASGLEHCLMVRTDQKTRARELQQVYNQHTSLKLKTIHSGLSLSLEFTQKNGELVKEESFVFCGAEVIVEFTQKNGELVKEESFVFCGAEVIET